MTSEENNSTSQTKEELEAELLEVRKEIQWREREQEENKESSHQVVTVGISFLILVILFLIFGKEGREGIIFATWGIISIILAIFVEREFNKTSRGKWAKKAIQELSDLKKKRNELEEKLDDLEKSEKHKVKRKGEN
ncbi:MAG: Cell division protein DivIB [Mycoplasmataceae bacterium]|nr:MAG: Cell division protein DivIB [Mycoplasmataceae bacterium]